MLSDFITGYGGPILNGAVSLGVALAILNANIAIAIMSARQLYSSGRDQVWSENVNFALTRIHKKFHSPWIATLVFGFLSALACLIDQNLLFVIIGTSLVLIYAIMCVAVIVGRRSGTTSHTHYRLPWFPAVPLVGLLFLGYVLYANYLDEAVGRPSLWAAAAMIVLSLAYYILVLRRRGGWVLKGPDG
jgi:amino acid transporter